LQYYESNEITNATPARGKIDLTADFEITSGGIIEGSPTSYTISIMPFNTNEERWKLCAETKEDHTKWSLVIESFSGLKETSPEG
jgi:hypothetical protein